MSNHGACATAAPTCSPVSRAARTSTRANTPSSASAPGSPAASSTKRTWSDDRDKEGGQDGTHRLARIPWPSGCGRGSRARVPPGQYVTQDFPVLSAGPTPHTAQELWDFSIVGELAEPPAWT